MTFLPPFPRFLVAVWIVCSLMLGCMFAFAPPEVELPPWWAAPFIVGAFATFGALFMFLLAGPRIFTDHDHL